MVQTESANASTAVGEKPKANLPPTVITVDTAGKDVAVTDDLSAAPSKEEASEQKDFGQARTPKHANKTSSDEAAGKDGAHARAPPAGSHARHHSRGPPPGYHEGGNFAPNRPFEGRMGGSGAFQPRDRQGYPARGPPMQVSPGGGRYYANPGNFQHGGPPNGGPPNRYPNNGPYEQRYGGEYQQRFDGPNGPPPPGNFQRGPYGGPPPMFPGQQQNQQQQQQQFDGGYESGQGPPPSWGPPPATFPHGRPPHFGAGGVPSEHYQRPQANNNGNFSRAVSSSFDRSIKSHAHDEKQGRTNMDVSPKLAPGQAPVGDNGSVSEDGSWGALKQVASVDEDVMRKRSLKKQQEAVANKQGDAKQPHSTSSSLTNSPNEGADSKKATGPDAAKLTSSLDSLSSVASVQEPIGSNKNAANNPSSPGGSAGSLDLMKCASGSSGLLLPPHQRSLSQFSFPGGDSTGKRARDEEREDMHTAKAAAGAGDDEIRGAPPVKKTCLNDKDAKKTSPLSITCSPPNTPSGDKSKGEGKTHQPQPVYPHPTSKDASAGQIDAFYDHDASFNYSMDSAPTMPVSQMGYLHLPGRPGSSASSTITPMNVDGANNDNRQAPPGVGQMPSWELNAQDSFGAGSAGGPLIPNFSFSQDYPMLAQSASHENLQQQQPVPHPGMHPGQPKQQDGQQALESRNQSFEGGHYHGSFNRSDSMMSYEGQGRMGAPSFEGRQGYQGQFPPHAPSWGSAGSYPQPPPPGYGQYRRGAGGPQYPGMMRNYSEDSGRNSPPQGPPGMRVMPPNFQPPPEFRAPPSMVSKTAPQSAHIMSASPYVSTKNGPFGWSKEEDMRLTDIMKKYKNPRDWEPISKEHNRGRSAKECHERWIRYLKPGVRKGQWTDHEDAIVMEVVSTSTEQPFTRWSDLAQRLPGRVGKQIRDRWVNHLNPNINHLPFSREDDMMLWDGHTKLGKRWVEISTKYFKSSRSENHIKNRWYSASFKKFIANEFGPNAYTGGKSPKKNASGAKKVTKRDPAPMDPSQVEAV